MPHTIIEMQTMDAIISMARELRRIREILEFRWNTPKHSVFPEYLADKKES